jgi:sec-independent protein translocase protein TatB
MFDIGFSELLVIAVVALLVLGPERLPKAARFAGLWMRRARAQWYSVKSELEHELATDELRRNLRETQDELRDAHSRVQREGEALQRELADAVPGDTDDNAARVAAPGSSAAPPAGMDDGESGAVVVSSAAHAGADVDAGAASSGDAASASAGGADDAPARSDGR